MSSTLERNLLALSVAAAPTARAILNTASRDGAEFFPTGDGEISGSLEGRLLASRIAPRGEAAKLAGSIDPRSAAAVVVLGFGMGHHVRAIAERMGPMSAVFVYEPDLDLVRSVLERVDHSAWLRKGNVVLLTDAEDGGAIAAATRGVEGLIGLGVKVIEHPASRARLAAGAQRFAEEFTKVVGAIKTNVVTTLVQTETSVRNMLMNADRYATSAGIADLENAAHGRPAIVVAAGPSLKRNIELLSKPGVRDRFVIIAVQTVLKQLLARGIRPHFVTALDYHEISRRFYEGLTREAVDGVTLVAESKANPAILEAFPGVLRMPRERMLDELVGSELAIERGQIKPGATVAHLAYYLARHIGCNPVILVGQDLGFTDGQYYSAGAAIHDVWSGELNAFNTLEMMEWQRIVRTRTKLTRTTDTLGRSIYTDEQMSAYLVQFERDFRADADRGLLTIDATEGGVRKQQTTVMPLSEAMERYGHGKAIRLPEARPFTDTPARLRKLESRLKQVRSDVWRVGNDCGRTKELLEQMVKLHGDHRRVNELIGKVEKIRDGVMKLKPAFDLVDYINQAGTLKRMRADREIGLEQSLPPLERQRRQIERDITNVRWMGEAADSLGNLLEATLKSLAGEPKLTRDLPGKPEDRAVGEAAAPVAPRRVVALVPVDADVSGLGTPRKLEDSLLGDNPLRLMLKRLARAQELDGVLLLTHEPERVAKLIGEVPGLKVEIVRTAEPPLRARAEAVRGGRLWARSSWRGGLAGMTVYDEVLAPRAMNAAMTERGIDAAAVVGADWCCIDPGLVDEAVRRYRQNPTGPSSHRLTFVQAPPGLGTAVIERSMMRELADRSEKAGVYASIGAMLGYVPIAPMSDPIVKPVCVATDAHVRDSQFRYIPDSGPRRQALGKALAACPDVVGASASALATLVREHQLQPPPGPPQELMLELCTGRRTSGPRGVWLRGTADSVERPVLALGASERLLGELGQSREDAAVTFAGAGDPLQHPELCKVVALARRAGVAGLHVRTDLACEPDLIDRLLDAPVDIISIDLMAESADVYRRLMGADLLAKVRANLERLILGRQQRPTKGGLPTPWIVPRMTRCDAAYEDIEPFFDRWLLGAGAAVIEAPPSAIPGDRIEPLPVPAGAARRLGRERMAVLSDGCVPALETDLSGERCVGNVLKEGLLPVWRRLVTRRYEVLVEPRPEPALHGGHVRSRVARLIAES